MKGPSYTCPLAPSPCPLPGGEGVGEEGEGRGEGRFLAPYDVGRFMLQVFG